MHIKESWKMIYIIIRLHNCHNVLASIYVTKGASVGVSFVFYLNEIVYTFWYERVKERWETYTHGTHKP